jgi:predicted helicase
MSAQILLKILNIHRQKASSERNSGVICFMSKDSCLACNCTDGFRKVLEQEFNGIYVFNLQRNQHNSGELSRNEGGKIFGSGSCTPIAIAISVNKPK